MSKASDRNYPEWIVLAKTYASWVMFLMATSAIILWPICYFYSAATTPYLFIQPSNVLSSQLALNSSWRPFSIACLFFAYWKSCVSVITIVAPIVAVISMLIDKGSRWAMLAAALVVTACGALPIVLPQKFSSQQWVAEKAKGSQFKRRLMLQSLLHQASIKSLDASQLYEYLGPPDQCPNVYPQRGATPHSDYDLDQGACLAIYFDLGKVRSWELSTFKPN